MTQKIAFIFGLGFTGKAIARELIKNGWHVRATTRNKDALGGASLGVELAGVELVPFSAGTPIANPAANSAANPIANLAATPAPFQGVSHVISTIPVIDGEDCVLATHGNDLRALNCWTGYISATSVYSEANGGWVNEESPTNPISARGQLRRMAEIKWQETLGSEIFRAAGIYGPGRSPFTKLLANKARIIHKPGHLFNRIHVDDIARIVTTAMQKPQALRIINRDSPMAPLARRAMLSAMGQNCWGSPHRHQWLLKTQNSHPWHEVSMQPHAVLITPRLNMHWGLICSIPIIVLGCGRC